MLFPSLQIHSHCLQKNTCTRQLFIGSIHLQSTASYSFTLLYYITSAIAYLTTWSNGTLNTQIVRQFLATSVDN